MASATLIVTPSSVDDLVCDVREVTKPAGPQRQISERSAAAGTVSTHTDAESLSLSSSSIGSEIQAMDPEMEDSYSEPPATSFSHLSISTASSVSILKTQNKDPSTIKDSKRAWKCLPKPDLDTIIGNASSASDTTATTALDESLSSSHKRVEWGVVQIRSYAQCIGDNPSVSYGTPISLDWDYEPQEDVDLDLYELNRGTRRTLRQMVLSYYHRKNVLSWQYGHTEAEIKAAKKEASRAKFKREITRSFLIAMPAEAAVESARRKAKRFFEKKE